MKEFTGLALLVGSICAWFTHVFYCFDHGKWGFLLAGALAFPIAICHGVYIWFH